MLIKNTKDILSFLAGDETIIKEVLHPKNDELALNYSLALARLEPGKRSLPHILKDSSEVYIIIKGSARVHIGSEQQEMETGQVVFIPAGVEQWIENTGDAPLEFYCVVSPPWSEQQEEVESNS